MCPVANRSTTMPYTLILRGVVIGETDFEHHGQGPRQQAGIFRPAPSGLADLPKITGMFAASLAFMRVVERNKSTGLSDADDTASLTAGEHARGPKVGRARQGYLRARAPRPGRQCTSHRVDRRFEPAGARRSRRVEAGQDRPRERATQVSHFRDRSADRYRRRAASRLMPAFGIAGAGDRNFLQ